MRFNRFGWFFFFISLPFGYRISVTIFCVRFFVVAAVAIFWFLLRWISQTYYSSTDTKVPQQQKKNMKNNNGKKNNKKGMCASTLVWHAYLIFMSFVFFFFCVLCTEKFYASIVLFCVCVCVLNCGKSRKWSFSVISSPSSLSFKLTDFLSKWEMIVAF